MLSTPSHHNILGLMRIAPVLLIVFAASYACSESSSPAKPSPLASIKIVSGANQTAPAGTTLPESIAVVATDSNGRPGVNLSVAWVPSTGASTGTSSSVTDNSGRAATTWTLDTVVGRQSLYLSVQDATNRNNLLQDSVIATATAH